jgi:chromosome segregation ATPase
MRRRDQEFVMALPALKLDTEEEVVEERLARLEANVEHLQSDVTEIKTDVRRLNDKVDKLDEKWTRKIDGVDAKLTAKIDAVDEKLTGKIDGLATKLSTDIKEGDLKCLGKIDELKDALIKFQLSVERQFAKDRVWWLLMCGALLGVMAKGFKWL